MKNLLFVLVCLLPLPSFAVNEAALRAHKTTHKIEMKNVLFGNGGHCSATAIAPHALLTAAHCLKPAATIDVDGSPTDVLGVIGDGVDHMVLLVRAEFKDVAELSDKAPVVTDEVFIFGNPGRFDDMYRRGTASGTEETRGVNTVSYDLNGFFGDSGSGIFTADGKLAAVTSIVAGDEYDGVTIKFMGSFELRFTKEQIAAAKGYVPPADKKQEVTDAQEMFLDFLLKHKR